MGNVLKERKQNSFMSLQNLVKVYPNGEKAVYNFDLDIAKNEFIVIVGPSGCGKSTTLRMIAGLEDISGGDIYLESELLNYKPSSERKMAIVFQSYALYPQMTVYNNIAFPLTINKYPMPKENAVLKANAEIEKLLSTVAWNKFIGVLFNVYNGNGKAKDEQIATIFGITLYAAKLLYKAFGAYCRETLESLDGKAEEISVAIRAELKPLVEAENAKVQESGVKLDEDFCEVDGDGNKIIEPRKYTPYEIKTRVYETAEKLDLIPYLDKLPKELSGGQMQRVALGRAIIKNVPVFMMDEPLSNLDAKLRLSMRSEIVKLHNRIGATTIYVTHDQTEAMTMASRIVVMSRGFIQQIGTPEEVYQDPANIFVAKFIGSPSMNVFNIYYDPESGCLERNDVKIPLKAEFKKRHDEFYATAVDKFEGLQSNFDEKAREEILKILSSTGEFKDNKKPQKKKGLIALIKRLIEKQKNKKIVVDEYAYEKEVLGEKLAQLKTNATAKHGLLVGIRPERIKIEKVVAGKKYKGVVKVKSTVVELLGGEYNIHFDLFDKDMVCKLDATEKVTTDDELAVSFSPDDLYIFDLVTGDRI